MSKKLQADNAELKKWYDHVFETYRKNWSILSDQAIADLLEVDLRDYRGYKSTEWFLKRKSKEWKEFKKKHHLGYGTISLQNLVDFKERIARKDPYVGIADAVYFYTQYMLRYGPVYDGDK